MTYENVIYEKKGSIARITMNRPEKMNALNDDLLFDLEQSMAEADRDLDVSVVIIAGKGDAFSAGYDFEKAEWQKTNAKSKGKYPTTTQEDSPRPGSDRMRGDYERYQWFDHFFNFSKITIAEVNGFCLSGGCYLQMLCDLSIASEKATFGHPARRKFGGVGSMPMWIWLLGARKAKELILTAKIISAEEACRIGLVNRVVPEAELESEVMALAEEVSAIHPEGQGIMKQAMNMTLDIMGFSTALRYRSQIHALAGLARKGETDKKLK